MKISLILLIKNGAQYLDRLFEALERQTVIINEIVMVDSGSTDKSLEILDSLKVKKFNGLKVFQIKPEEFGHGKTRNLAVRKASGEIVVFLTQDAVPTSKDWLKNLVRGFRDGGEVGKDRRIAGVFGRQIPYQTTNLCEKYFYQISYPENSRVMEKKDVDNFSNQNLFFSNVSGAVRRDLLLKFPFREDLIMSEDQFWGREVLRAGYKIVYEPISVVWHSHNYNLIQLFKRYVQSGYSQRQMNLKGDVFVKGAGTALGLLGYLGKNKPWLLPFGIVYETVKGTAFILGKFGLCL